MKKTSQLTEEQMAKRAEDNKKVLAALTPKLQNPDSEVSAKELREFSTATNKPTLDEQVDNAWDVIQKAVKSAVLSGQVYAEIPVNGHHHPILRAKIAERLGVAGFSYEVRGVTGFIYW